MTIDCRSALFMPASNPRALAKGPTLSADAIIIDLEDSVAPQNKAAAREQAVNALNDSGFGYRLRALRINATGTQWYADDVAAAARCAPDAITLPKVETANDIAQLAALMDKHPSLQQTRIWAMMESPLAVVNAASIAASVKDYPQLSVFIIGSNDLALESQMPISKDRTCLMPWLMTLVASAKAFKLSILDSVYNDFADSEGFEAECVQGVNMGMNGKTLIHPSQLAIANRVFSPTADAIAKAEQVVQAFHLPENAEKGAISIDGRMVERLHIGMAEQLLARAKRLQLRE